MPTWTEMQAAVAAQMHTDPQRATLSERAWKQVEAGLSHLSGVGYNFEIAPKGTLGELVQLKESAPLTLPLSISDAVEQITGGPQNPMKSKFEAMIEG